VQGLGSSAGSIQATPPATVSVYQGDFLHLRLPVRIANHSNSDWPGFDNQSEGLVFVRYRFTKVTTAASETPVRVPSSLQAVAPLDVDIAAGRNVLVPIGIKGTIAPGTYRLTLELVQKLGDRYQPLPVSPLRTTITLLPARRDA